MHQSKILGKLAQTHAQAPLLSSLTGEFDLEFLNKNGTINFGNLH